MVVMLTQNVFFKFVKGILLQKPGGEKIVKEYQMSAGLRDATRRKLVNILVAEMVEKHG